MILLREASEPRQADLKDQDKEGHVILHLGPLAPAHHVIQEFTHTLPPHTGVFTLRETEAVMAL
jgi:hypothetical protein